METIIISLGGSVVVPKDIDLQFLKEFKKLILSFKDEYKFAIYVGGGIIARKYQKALIEIIGKDKEALDWLGISATHLNAFLLRCIFHENSEDFIIKDPTKQFDFNKQIVIAAGWKPGWSTDYDAVLLAKNLKTKNIVNITNVNYVYDKDPSKFKDAYPIHNISWKEFRKLISNQWDPGMNAPFDPIASAEAEKSNLKVAIMGKSIANLEKYLEDKKFRGTIIN